MIFAICNTNQNPSTSHTPVGKRPQMLLKLEGHLTNGGSKLQANRKKLEGRQFSRMSQLGMWLEIAAYKFTLPQSEAMKRKHYFLERCHSGEHYQPDIEQLDQHCYHQRERRGCTKSPTPLIHRVLRKCHSQSHGAIDSL